MMLAVLCLFSFLHCVFAQSGSLYLYPYTNSADISRQIVCSSGQRVQFDIVTFNLECNYDFLTLYEGTGVTGATIYRSSCSTSPGLRFYSSGRTATLRFTSDSSVTGNLQVTWTCQQGTSTRSPTRTPAPSSLACTELTYRDMITTQTCDGYNTQHCVMIDTRDLYLNPTITYVSWLTNFYLSTFSSDSTATYFSLSEEWNYTDNSTYIGPLCTPCWSGFVNSGSTSGCFAISAGTIRGYGGSTTKYCPTLTLTSSPSCSGDSNSSGHVSGGIIAVIIIFGVILPICCVIGLVALCIGGCCACLAKRPANPNDLEMQSSTSMPIATSSAVAVSGPAFGSSYAAPAQPMYPGPAPQAKIVDTFTPFNPQPYAPQPYAPQFGNPGVVASAGPNNFDILLDSLRKESSEFRRYDVLLPQVPSLGHVTKDQAMTLLELFTMSTTRDDVFRALKPVMSPDDLQAVVKAKVTSEFQQQILLDSLFK